MPTITSIENTLRAELDRLHEYRPKRQIKTLAKTVYHRWLAYQGDVDEFVARAISYSDPTGETAARNIDRERRAA